MLKLFLRGTTRAQTVLYSVAIVALAVSMTQSSDRADLALRSSEDALDRALEYTGFDREDSFRGADADQIARFVHHEILVRYAMQDTLRMVPVWEVAFDSVIIERRADPEDEGRRWAIMNFIVVLDARNGTLLEASSTVQPGFSMNAEGYEEIREVCDQLNTVKVIPDSTTPDISLQEALNQMFTRFLLNPESDLLVVNYGTRLPPRPGESRSIGGPPGEYIWEINQYYRAVPSRISYTPTEEHLIHRRTGINAFTGQSSGAEECSRQATPDDSPSRE